MNMTKMPQICPFKHSLLYHEANEHGGGWRSRFPAGDVGRAPVFLSPISSCGTFLLPNLFMPRPVNAASCLISPRSRPMNWGSAGAHREPPSARGCRYLCCPDIRLGSLGHECLLLGRYGKMGWEISTSFGSGCFGSYAGRTRSVLATWMVSVMFVPCAHL